MLAHPMQRSGIVSRRKLVVIVAIAVCVAIGIVVLTVTPDVRRGRLRQASADVRALQTAAAAHLDSHPRDCPTIEDLKRSRLLEGDHWTKDPWNRDFRIACELGRAIVASAGPDGELDTEDDVRASPNAP